MTSTIPGMATVDPGGLRNALWGYDEIPVRYVLGHMPQADALLPVLEAVLANLNND